MSEWKGLQGGSDVPEPPSAWWEVVPAGGAQGPAAAEPRGRPSRRRRVLPGLAVAGAMLLATAVGVPTLRAIAQTPVITTVPVTPAQEAVDAPAVGVFQRLRPSIVLVTNESTVQSYFGPQNQTDWGSGVVLTPNGYIVTNAHVVVGSRRITVTLANGQPLPATLVGADPSTDLAVIRVHPTRPLTPAVFANSNDVVPGELAIAIGNPLGPQFAETVTTGVVSAIRPMLYGFSPNGSVPPRVTEMIQTDAPINPGNSGGALANAQGEVIGITALKVAQTGEPGVSAIGLGFAIPSNVVVQIVNDLIRYGYVPRAWIGIALQASPTNALPTQAQTLTVTTVQAGSPAEAAGLQMGDVIVSWDHHPVVNYYDLVGDVNAAAPGQRVVLGILRQGHKIHVQLTLGELPRGLEEGTVSPSSASSPTAPPQPSSGQPFPFPFPFPFPLPSNGPSH